MLYDIVAALFSVILFIPILLAPGYVAAWSMDLFSFRTLASRWRLCVAIPLSLAISPISIYWLGRLLSWRAVDIVFGCLFLGWIVMISGFLGHEKFSLWSMSLRTIPRWVWLTALLWLVVAVSSLVDLQIGNRLYFSVVSNDYAVRTAITDAINREGVSPSNPFFHLTGDVPLRYHYFWFLPCSFVARLSGLTDSSRPAINASVVWCGWALLTLAPLYFRFFSNFRGQALMRRAQFATGFLLVTGLDIVPAILSWLRHQVKADMEWWNVGQITSWVGSLLWVPHNSASLVAGLIGFLVASCVKQSDSVAKHVAAGVLTSLAFATMVGCSVYVAFVFAAFLFIWTIFLLFRRPTKLALPLLVAGPLTTVLAVPYLQSLAGTSGGATFASFSVRAFTPAIAIAAHFHLTHRLTELVFLLFLPVQYIFELGFFAFVPFAYLLLRWRKRNMTMPDVGLFLLAAIPFFISSFFRSSVVGWSNDLGWRGFLPVQFVLLYWAADLFAIWRESEPKRVDHSHPWWRSVGWAALLILGASGTIYEIGILRLHGLFADAGICTPFFIPGRNLGALTYGLRQGYSALDQKLQRTALIQGNPNWSVYDFFLGLYSHRATASFNTTCGVEYGGDASACTQLIPEILEAFSSIHQDDPSKIESLATRLKTGAFVVYVLDPVWDHSWTKAIPAAYQNAFMRTYLFSKESAVSKARGTLNKPD